MRDRPIGGTILATGLVLIAGWAAIHYVVAPILCFFKAGCGAASW